MEIMRHVAKVANTDQRCIVAYMQIPGKEDHALVVPVDGLNPRIEQAIMQVLKSPEGQQEESFVNALHRHRMPDTGETILASLHKTGKLVPVPVANILMLPQPNKPIKLTFILEQLGRLPQQQVHDTTANASHYATDKFNPHINNHLAQATENTRSIARGLIMEAEMLEADARKKREHAYLQDPTCRPVPMTGAAAPTARPDPFALPPRPDPFALPIVQPMEEFFPIEEVEAKPSPMDAFASRLDRIEEMFAKLMDKDTAKVAIDEHDDGDGDEVPTPDASVVRAKVTNFGKGSIRKDAI
jgi:hypothetical protein